MFPGYFAKILKIAVLLFRDNLQMATFSHHDLQLLNPSFDSPLVDVLSELEFLRRLRLEGDTPPQVFFQGLVPHAGGLGIRSNRG